MPFRYRPIDLYEVLLPADRVIIGKQNNILQFFTETQDVFGK